MNRLVLFPSLRDSLGRGQQYGILLRNLALYERLVATGTFDQICCFTYDDRDRDRLATLKQSKLVSRSLEILPPPRLLRSRVGSMVYSVIGPFLHYRAIAQAGLLHTHQVSGSWTALIAKLITGKPLLFRLGYPLSVRFKTEGRHLRYLLARAVEWALVRFSDGIAVSSRSMQRYYASMWSGARVEVLPSYVDLSEFNAIEKYDATEPILFVGRLTPVKNIPSLITACGRLGVPVDIYGQGAIQPELEDLARDCGATVVFKGTVPNSELARRHHQHSIYVLCSTREGMPKSLIEAMASGLICVSTPTDGARELIDDGRTGYLTDGFDAEAIERTLRAVLADMRPDVGRNARDFVRRNNSLEHAVEVETKIIDGIMSNRRARHGQSPGRRRARSMSD
jgi:glycosyltransferase involved in cell wall biosynthesis